jgi:hypothetical protein
MKNSARRTFNTTNNFNSAQTMLTMIYLVKCHVCNDIPCKKIIIINVTKHYFKKIVYTYDTNKV